MMQCDICGKQYKRGGWLLRHRHQLQHWTPGQYIMQCDPNMVLGFSLMRVLKNLTIHEMSDEVYSKEALR